MFSLVAEWLDGGVYAPRAQSSRVASRTKILIRRHSWSRGEAVCTSPRTRETPRTSPRDQAAISVGRSTVRRPCPTR